ncbi:MAG: hypothetical protein BWY43_00534 [candidate division WS2 bacterium ADurb.Bin280]|uniref:Uncharacterized protein n=1 Tax=candidate division WS2 bacterium ADurb.Bin280 TaxID=1852829 RepID=A0A1V5SD67_9BACT|nr:MAG: hypothetical protein BWY43_00534 [candidate division WS2 bacterium ADurb.Bin280]
MQPVEILYLIVAVAVVVLTVALVWLILDLIKLSRSLRKSTDDVAIMTAEVKEKVLMVSEAIDRIGTLASHFIGLIEEAEKQIREKSEQISQGLGMVVGISDVLKKRRASNDEQEDQEPKKTTKKDKTQEDDDK